MKANRKVQPSKKLKRTSTAEAETMSPEELLEESRSVSKLARQMNLYLPEKDQRDALLTELYRMSIFKQVLDSFTATNREEVLEENARFRKYRLWLVRLDKELSTAMKAMQKAVDVVNSNPAKNNQDELETLIVRKTGTAIARSGNELQKAIDVVTHMQHSLAAGIHPTKRTDAENALIPQEPKGLKHIDLPLSEKTKQIEMSFIRYAASSLDKYRTKNGKPIRRHDKIIAHIFEFALNDPTRTDESVRKVLLPVRRKPRPLF